MSSAAAKKKKPSYVLGVSEVDPSKFVFNTEWEQSKDEANKAFGMGCGVSYNGPEGPGFITIKCPVMAVAFRWSVMKPDDTEDKMTISLTNKHVRLVDPEADIKDQAYELIPPSPDTPMRTADDTICANKVLEMFTLFQKISAVAYEHTIKGRSKKETMEVNVNFKPLVKHYQDKAKEYPPQEDLSLTVNSWRPDVKGAPKGTKGPLEITTAFFEMMGGNRKDYRKMNWPEAKELFTQGAETVAYITFNRIWWGSTAISLKPRITKMVLVKRGNKRTREIKPDIDDDIYIPAYAPVVDEEETRHEDEDAMMAAAVDAFENSATI